jgi:alkylated DNA nucleotide flippase Atl1
VSASEDQAAARGKLHELMALGEAERTVADVRMADLKAEQDAAWRRHIAAKGGVTRARKDGSAEKIAAAVKREREAYGEFMAVSDASISEMFALNRAGLDRLGELLDHLGPAWDADAAALREITREPEAGQ